MQEEKLKSSLGIILQNRKAFKRILDMHSIEQCNIIPKGFNNNIFWNCAHVIAVQQRLINGLAGSAFDVPESWVNEFLPGTRPERLYTEDDKVLLVQYLTDSYGLMKDKVNTRSYQDINPFMTALKFEIRDMEDAVTFNLFHEALHMGHILNLMKFVWSS